MFQDVPDPRAENARHRLVDLLAIALLAVIAGADDYPGIVEFGRDREPWLRRFLALPHGVASVSTFRRLFAAIRPEALDDVLRRWSTELVKTCRDKQIAIDGKTLRRSFEHAWKKSGLHVVTAWCVEDRVVLGQEAVDEKSNEITAVPKLLETMDVKNAVVTVDALNTQKAIARQIVDAGGDYVMAVKANHPALFACVERNVRSMRLEKFAGVNHSVDDGTEGGHGRIDRRRVWAVGEVDWIEQQEQWAGLRSLVVVEATRTVLGETSVELRYYLSSLPADARRQGKLVRNHWGIENGQHWCLDMGFREDESRVRKDHGDQNLAVMRRIALNLLRQDKSVKLGIKNKRLKASRNSDYLLRVVTGTSNAK
jgi:predicted transposase YbfD/YdcC